MIKNLASFREKVRRKLLNKFFLSDYFLSKLVKDSIATLADDSGWVFLGDLGNYLLKRKPDFDPRNYGFQKLWPLIKSLSFIEADERETGKGKIKHIFVRSRK